MRLLIALFLLSTSYAGHHGIASWYGEELRGSPMANGQPFNPSLFTCATWLYPMGTVLRVEHEGRYVLVLVTDRGPHKRYKKRIIDLSYAAFSSLAHPDLGLIEVSIHPIQP